MYLSDISGVTAVNVDLQKKTVEINSDRKIELNEVREALKETHYEATN
jgi:copper chaperone CopZ